MKNKILPIVFVFAALFAANQASAYYCPSTGRWLSRDPNGELGFETLRASSAVPRVGQIASTAFLPPSRLAKRDTIATKSEPNRYGFVQNDPIEKIDAFGLYATLDTSGCKNHAADINSAWNTATAAMQNYLDTHNDEGPTGLEGVFDNMFHDNKTVPIKCGGCYGWLKCKLAGNPPAVIGLSSVYLCGDKISPCLLAATLAVEVSKVDCGVTAVGQEIPFSDWLHKTMCPNEKW